MSSKLLTRLAIPRFLFGYLCEGFRGRLKHGRVGAPCAQAHDTWGKSQDDQSCGRIRSKRWNARMARKRCRPRHRSRSCKRRCCHVEVRCHELVASLVEALWPVGHRGSKPKQCGSTSRNLSTRRRALVVMLPIRHNPFGLQGGPCRKNHGASQRATLPRAPVVDTGRKRACSELYLPIGIPSKPSGSKACLALQRPGTGFPSICHVRASCCCFESRLNSSECTIARKLPIPSACS